MCLFRIKLVVGDTRLESPSVRALGGLVGPVVTFEDDRDVIQLWLAAVPAQHRVFQPFPVPALPVFAAPVGPPELLARERAQRDRSPAVSFHRTEQNN